MTRIRPAADGNIKVTGSWTGHPLSNLITRTNLLNSKDEILKTILFSVQGVPKAKSHI